MLIGINGIKGSGKDYFGKIMQSILTSEGGNHPIAKFADPIRITVESIYGEMTEDQYDEFKRVDHLNCTTGKMIPGRDIVRGIGMKMRSYDGGKQFLDFVKAVSESTAGTTIVTDLRFGNEFDIGWDYTVKVESGKESDGTESEQVWPDDKFDFVILNQEEGEELSTAVMLVMMSIMGYDVPEPSIDYFFCGDSVLFKGYDTELVINRPTF